MALTKTIRLIDGGEVTVNIALVSTREYRALFDKSQEQADEDRTIAKAAGLTVDQLIDLPQPDYRRVTAAFLELARSPLDDPK